MVLLKHKQPLWNNLEIDKRDDISVCRRMEAILDDGCYFHCISLHFIVISLLCYSCISYELFYAYLLNNKVAM